MIYKKAIKAIEKRIEALNDEFKKAKERAEEPEMVCDYEFAINDMANIELEIIELQQAIMILNNDK